MIFADAIAVLSLSLWAAGIGLAVAPWLWLAGRGAGAPVLGAVLAVLATLPAVLVATLWLLVGLLHGELAAMIALAGLVGLILGIRTHRQRMDLRHHRERIRRLRRHSAA